MTNVSIVVPVYADWPSLKLNIQSLKKYYGNKPWLRVYYVNDCGPEAPILEKKITNTIRNTGNFYYHANDENLGFVKNCNNAVFNIIPQDDDVLLLNSDTKVTKGFLEELVRVLYSDESIGIVNPRSSNATVWSVPMDASLAERPQKSYEYWGKLKKLIPEKYIAPTSHGFCMLIRREIINELGLFDEVYGKGYGEENDFTMRALEHGWKCAVANYAYVFHFESKSFGTAQRLDAYKKNREILLGRYPNYENMVHEYLQTTVEPNPVSDSLVWRAFVKANRAIEFGHYNGYDVMFNRTLAYTKKRVLGNRKTPHVEAEQEPVPIQSKIKIWTHELSDTGAPLTMLNLLRQWIERDSSITEKLEVWYGEGSYVNKNSYASLINLGIAPPVSNSVLQRRFEKGDIVIVNSSAYPMWFFDDLLTNLENNTIEHVFWYVHEDSHMFTSAFWDFNNLHSHNMEDSNRYRAIKQRLQAAVRNNSLSMYYPSRGAKKNWVRWLGASQNQYVSQVLINIPESHVLVRPEQHFDVINFITVGTIAPHKGQLSVVDAFIAFYNRYYLHDPQKYRDFSLGIAGIDDNYQNFYNAAVINAADGLPKGKIKLYKKSPQASIHKLIKASNFTITYSLVDSFSLVTMEGMAYGHPIIRSESSGREEQLRQNGWGVSTHDFEGLVNVIEEVLNKSRTTNVTLAEMSKASVELARKNIRSKYRIIDDVEKFIRKNSKQ